MKSNNAEGMLRPLTPSASGGTVQEPDLVASLKSEIQTLKAKLAEVEQRTKETLLDRDSKMHGLLIRLVELEPYPARYRELETRYRVTVAERDARILELERKLAGAQRPAGVDDESTRKPKAPDKDDLKAIHGIGDQLEVLLNSLGVRWYRQIAAWTPEDVAFYATKLDHFPGRIDREEWVSHARQLHEHKYGEKL